MLTTVDDVARAFETEERLAAWKVRDKTAAYVEIERDEVVLVLAWPELWQDAEAFDAHRTRARSGNYSLILFGSDEPCTTRTRMGLPGIRRQRPVLRCDATVDIVFVAR